MNTKLFFSGRQIKNYIIGFGSLFADIPYLDSRGKIQNVPIHYGSQSDVISHLENNVDNEATHNVNRLKDVSIPLFSFRMAALEKNTDKRRDPLTTKTRDLRPMGYNTAYTTMSPTPMVFTMELTLWASSDYQCFEILEQILPYFNSPQQVTIEPLPNSQARTTEVFLESVDIDTDPESNKFSAKSTLSFNLTGWLYTQPKIWATNLKFELSIIDQQFDDTIFSTMQESKSKRDVEFIERSDYKKIQQSNVSNTFKDFVLLGNLRHNYTLDFLIYEYMIENNIIDSNNSILKSDEFVFEINNSNLYKNTISNINFERIKYIINTITDLQYLHKNQLMQENLNNPLLDGSYLILEEILNNNDKKLIETFLILVDLHLVSSGFNMNRPILPSEKLEYFGDFTCDVEAILYRLRMFIASVQDFKVNNYKFKDCSFDDNVENIIYNIKFTDLEDYMLSYLLYHSIADASTIEDNKYFKIFNNKYNINVDELVTKSSDFEQFIKSIIPYKGEIQ